MGRTRALPVLLCLLAAASGTAAEVGGQPLPAVVEQLLGSWEGEGELFGRPATFSMRWSRALANRFVELRFENRLVGEDGSEQTVLEALALYRPSENDAAATLSGSWFDTRGKVVALEATATADTLSTHWVAADEEGRTAYRVIDADTVKVEDHVLRDGEWHPFGAATYRRSRHGPDGPD